VDFIFEQIRIGGDRNFGYLLGDRSAGVAVAIDPAFSPADLLARAEAQGLEIQTILNTHGHLDHTNGNAWLEKRTGAPVAHPTEGDRVPVGRWELRVWRVPGHTDDHLLFWLPEQALAVTGDLLFVGKVGGTATEEQARAEYASLQRILREMPDETTIWPGHDYGCRPATTIALEKVANPFLLAEDFDAFFRLKQDWAAYKVRLGLR